MNAERFQVNLLIQDVCGVIKHIKLKIYKVYQYIHELINMNKFK